MPPVKKQPANAGAKWLAALDKQGLEVQSATDACQVLGWLDSGSYVLNWAMSGRFLLGYPLGRSCEVFGDPGTGKTFLLARAIAMAQRLGGVGMLDDTEGAWGAEWMKVCGIEPDSLGVRSSATVNQHLTVAQAFCKAYNDLKLKTPGVLALDSMALLSTEHELEVGLDKKDMTKAAEIKAFFRIIGHELNKIPVIYLAANHTIANIGGWGGSRTTGGGGGLKFQASIRLDLRAVNRLKHGNDYTGVICRVVVDKNRFTAPWKEVQLAIPFYKPISPVSGLIPTLIKLGVLKVDGQFLAIKDGDSWDKLKIKANVSKEHFLQQDDSAEMLLHEFPNLLKEVDEELQEAASAPWEGGEEEPPAAEEGEPEEE